MTNRNYRNDLERLRYKDANWKKDNKIKKNEFHLYLKNFIIFFI